MVRTDPQAATNHSFTLDRGLRALWCLHRQPNGLSVTELARTLDTHRTAVYRLLSPLLDNRLIRRLDDGRYVLDAGLIELAGGVAPRLQEAALPVLQQLAADLGATTALTLRDGDEAVVASVVTPPGQVIHVTYRLGMRHALTAGAPGHALVAASPPRDGEAPEATAARRRGWSLSEGQLLPGATGVAAPIHVPEPGPAAVLSAVWISGVDLQQAGAAVAEAAAELTRTLGG